MLTAARAAESMAPDVPSASVPPVRRGCPWDCGPCALHAGTCHLPVFSVTNQCNMSCPICFTYNRTDPAYFMTRDELRRLLDGVIQRAAPLDLVDVTGGEPTLHPEILELLAECRRPEIGRVAMNSNGLRLAEDRDFCRRLADLGIYVILSFQTLRPETSLRFHGRDVVDSKLRALENLQDAGVGTTLLNVMARGWNEDEIGAIIELANRFSVVRGVTVQTMTYTGQGGKSFAPREHLPLDGAAEAIERSTGGRMSADHFFPHPGAHPLCYSVAYYLKCDSGPRSFTEFFSVGQLRDMLAGGYLLQPSDRNQGVFAESLDRLWAEGSHDDVLARFKAMMKRMFPSGGALTRFERQRLAEQDVLSVYLHAHMDEDTLDLGRLIVCPDQVPDSEGRMVPACAYNLFYRMADERFYSEG